MSNVVALKPELVGPGRKLEAARILAGARRAKLDEAVVFGYDKDGELYVASTEGPGDTMWLLEAAKLFLLNGAQRD
jgi:hypothetical protein